MQDIFIGVDVAKEWLDIYHPGGGARRIGNVPKAIKAFVSACAKENAWIIFEASGGYDRPLRESLESAQVRYSRVNPRQARDFARAMGVIGKTDRVDARAFRVWRSSPPGTDPAARVGAPRSSGASDPPPPAG